MATTQKTGTRGGKGNGNGKGANKPDPSIVDETLKTLDKGEVPPKAPDAPDQGTPKMDESQHDKRFLAVSEGACLTAMQRAFGFGKAALHLECAVALTVFAFSDKGASKEATERLKQIYTEAGFDTNVDGDDYKTVMRRIGAFGKLYNKMDRREIIGAMDGRTENEAIESLKNYLTTEYNFTGINAVLAMAGEPVKQTNTPEYREGKGKDKDADKEPTQAKGDNAKPEPAKTEPTGTAPEPQAASPEDQATAAKLGERMQNRRSGDNAGPFQRRLTDQPNAIVFSTEHLHVAIPRDVSRTEVLDMAAKLMQFAATMDFEAEDKRQQSNPRQPAHAGGDRRQHH
jgi:hypothetical protein